MARQLQESQLSLPEVDRGAPSPYQAHKQAAGQGRAQRKGAEVSVAQAAQRGPSLRAFPTQAWDEALAGWFWLSEGSSVLAAFNNACSRSLNSARV